MNGTKAKRMRIARGLSQSKLSDITGIQQARLSGYELDKHELSLKELSVVAKALESISDDQIKKLKKKRYQKHVIDGSVISSRPTRSYCKTARNDEYLEQLKTLETRFHAVQNRQLKALSFFAGGGGLCYGIKAAGFQLVASNELEEAHKNIYRMNFPDAEFLPNDIREIADVDLDRVLKEYQSIDLMIGGPPCQGFSLAGKRDVNDLRNTLFQDYLHIAKRIRPRVILMENVRLLASMKDSDGKYVSKRILETFNSIGYTCSFFNVNAKNYGVAQDRERVIFVGVRSDISISPSIPEASHGNIDDLFRVQSPFYSFGDAVSDLEYIESGEHSSTDKLHQAVSHPEHVIRWLVDVPEGKSAHENDDEKLRPPSGYNTTYKRQVWNEPAGTVATTYGMISGCRNVHPIATRSLTTREALRLQSFPDGFQLCGNQGDIRTTIGNAVPPLLAYSLGEHIRDHYIL